MPLSERQAFEEEILKRYTDDYDKDNIVVVELICNAIAFIFDFYHFSIQMNTKSVFYTSVEEKTKEEYSNQQYKGLPVGTVLSIVGLTAELSKYFIEDLIETETEFDLAFGKRLDSYTLSCFKKMDSDFSEDKLTTYIAHMIVKALHNAVIVYVKRFIWI
jgi:hypothetical protein